MAVDTDWTKKKNWWEEKKGGVNTAIYDVLSALEEEQSTRRERNFESLRLYDGTTYDYSAPHGFNRTETAQLPENRVKMNIISSMCDTVSAKISKMKPKVSYLTSGGDWRAQQKAKKLTKFMDGLFYRNSIYDLHQQAFKDSTIFDIGAIKHYVEDGEIKSERVLPTELYVDQMDAMYGKPTSLYQVKFVHKNVLQKQYPGQKAAIIRSSSQISNRDHYDSSRDEYAAVTEAWHLPSTKDSGDGRHVICTDQVTLVDEDYEKDYFPFTFFTWSPAVLGFYGQSLAERLTGNQVEINKMLRIIQRSFHLGSAFKVFLQHGSKVAKDHINNQIGSIIYYQGNPPHFYTPQTVHPEFFQHLDWLIQSSYEEAGVSQMTASSKIPAGIDGGSGKAIREYNDLETERFILIAQRYESSFPETADVYWDLAKDLYEAGEDIEVKGESKRFLESIKFSEINVDRNEFVIKHYPTSNLPQKPAGRLAYVQELIQGGFVDREYALKLLDFPDIDAYSDMQTAPLDMLFETVDKLLYEGEYIPPEPYMNLEKGIEVMQMFYNKARMDGAPEERLDNLRRWISQADQMLTKGQKPARPQGQPQQAPTAPQGQQLQAVTQGPPTQGTGGQGMGQTPVPPQGG